MSNVDPFAPVERGKWISVSRGVPEEGEPFLYLTRNKKIMVCQNRPIDEWFIMKYAVTHWMYFPELPDVD
ncbi:uncharacterized protein DUF551 [Spirosoma oryzae]|uniref:Uncharacterized protein DUF551 n=1 Tax=Spirosoma oryzae TaxID=1469603 RepID=A0A2T0S8W0_9BACT|nr:uncharacterized protein DUF551 [Spirosoma oryzae]